MKIYIFTTLICTLLASASSYAQNFRNLNFDTLVDGKLAHWALEGEGKYELLTSDKPLDTVTLYNEGALFVKLYTYDTTQIQSAKLVQRAKYDGIYVKDIKIKERNFTDDTTKGRAAVFYVKLYFWDTALSARRYTYSTGLPFPSLSKAFPIPDTLGLSNLNLEGLDFPAPNPTYRADSIEISLGVLDFSYPQFKQRFYFDDLELRYTSAGVSPVAILPSRLYPNPAIGSFTLDFDDNSPKQVHIFDVTGKLVHSQEVNGTSATIPTHTWAEGVYMVRCIAEQGTSTHKLIKQ